MMIAAKRLVISTLTAATLVTSGCGVVGSIRNLGSPGGSLETVSLGAQPVRLETEYGAAVYSDDLTSDLSFYFVDDADDATANQIIRLEVLWRAKPGATPMDPTATNISLRYLVFADGELGVYEGGGFARTRGTPGDDRMTVDIQEASIRLTQSTDGFVDALGPAQISGSVTAELDRKRARDMHYALSQRATDTLGRSTLVRR